ncbi:Pterin 4 alpha carbinolamine dehydratase [Trypanosoma melophagium]|uniref:Pterin 4 alpha carbinolamine dehydratase n=1 Tax=Trypanosoma melophagium TaxID=715481 RepID=UPI00351A4B88|nr:Pterin 4 alpha carbinolamine dehydratase [Trypanosoma melophagium]
MSRLANSTGDAVYFRLQFRRFRRCFLSSCIPYGDPFYHSLLVSYREKGDYGFNVFHNSNPQHGGSYARHERRMRDDELEDFLKSVKGWVPVDEFVAREGTGAGVEEGPSALTIFTGEEALKREFDFPNFRDAYLFMGRFWAFCYGSDKYPHVVWEGTRITVYLYSPSFRGISKREARIAAFLNDQYNMFKKSKRQQEQLLNGVVKPAKVERLMGDSVTEVLQRREEDRHRPLMEKVKGTASVWESLIDETSNGDKRSSSSSG